MNNNCLQSLISNTGQYLFLTVMAFVFAGCTLSQDSTVSTSLPETSAETFTPMKTRLVDKANSTLEPGYLENTIESEATPEAILENNINPSDSTASSPANITPLKPTVAMPTPTRAPFITSDLDRFGVTIARINHDAEAAFALGLPFGSALNWNVMRQPPEVPAEFWQLVRVNEEGIRSTDWGTIEEVLTAYPGSYWIVGNEPDVQWQDNVTPQRYAEIYHEVYTFIKEKDPSAIVVIGGVAQPTPLRRAYLDIVLDTYESNYGVPMPIDVWNVHAFILREEEDSWGVGIPPGLEEEEGILYEIEDHDNMQILEQNIRDFREWMAGRGYGERPLVISEYGILMPEDYGFPPERVSAFLESSFDLFNELVGESGYSSDGNRLVQWWFWYSIYDDLLYPTGNLWDEKTGQLTKLGQSWTRYLNMKGINKTDQGDTADH